MGWQEVDEERKCRPRNEDAQASVLSSWHKSASSVRIVEVPERHPGEDKAEPGEERDVVETRERLRMDAEPEEGPRARDGVCGVARNQAGDACKDEIRRAKARKERRDQDGDPDEMENAKDDIDIRQEEPGNSSYDEPVAEYRKAAPDGLSVRSRPASARSSGHN